jgi:RHS repeat-associated protein
MECSKFASYLDGEVECQLIITYDADGNEVSRDIEYGPAAEEPVVLCPLGTSECRAEYEPFEVRFDGLGLETDDNLYYEQARRFDPSKGRWLSQDPMGFEAGDSNLFRYHMPAVGRFLEDR